MSCDKKVTLGLLFDCADMPKKGIDGGRGVIINWEDIDWAATTVSGSIVSDLVLKSGTAGLEVQWYKDLASANGNFAPSTEDIDGFVHSFLTRLGNSSAVNADRAEELAQGRFVMVYETRYKGSASADAFKIAGFQHGMKLSEMAYNTAENSGTTLFTLASEEGDFEQHPYNIFLETNYATSLATFESLFATV